MSASEAGRERLGLTLIRYLTTWVNACWGIGQLLALAVLRGLLPRQDDWGWRIPYALQVRVSINHCS